MNEKLPIGNVSPESLARMAASVCPVIRLVSYEVALRALRGAGLSYAAIARFLSSKLGSDIDRHTVARVCRRLGI